VWVPRTAFVLFTLASWAVPSRAADPSVSLRTVHRFVFLGEFSNVRSTEEHNYGVVVSLWSLGSSVVGLLDVADGLQGDTPVGRLEGVRFDPASGRISFRAKLSVGRHYCLQHKTGVPSRDLFEFSGRLDRKALAGTLVHSDSRHPEHAAKIELITLRKIERASQLEAADYAEWKTRTDAILKRRGPQW